MNYEDMSDFEINKCVAEAAGMELSSDHSGACVGVVRRSIGSRPNYGHVNYCSNPSDAWPIILENKITIFSPNDTHDDSLWMAELDESHMFSANPLRAAMIAFLMMQESTCHKT